MEINKGEKRMNIHLKNRQISNLEGRQAEYKLEESSGRKLAQGNVENCNRIEIEQRSW